MRKLISIAVLISCFFSIAEAQDRFIDHLSVGINYGTTSMRARTRYGYMPLGRQTDGVGIEVAAQLTDWMEMRAGISTTIWGDGADTVNVEGVPDGRYVTEDIELSYEYGAVSGSLFMDFYPFRNTSFHFTAGAYAGSNRLLTVCNTVAVPEELASYDTGVAEIYGLAIPTDKNGKIAASLRMPAVRPYLGVGISTGRMACHRVRADIDLGVMYKGRRGMSIEAPDGSEVEIGYWRSDHYLARMVEWNKKCAVAPVLSFRFFHKNILNS